MLSGRVVPLITLRGSPCVVAFVKDRRSRFSIVQYFTLCRTGVSHRVPHPLLLAMAPRIAAVPFAPRPPLASPVTNVTFRVYHHCRRSCNRIRSRATVAEIASPFAIAIGFGLVAVLCQHSYRCPRPLSASLLYSRLTSLTVSVDEEISQSTALTVQRLTPTLFLCVHLLCIVADRTLRIKLIE